MRAPLGLWKDEREQRTEERVSNPEQLGSPLQQGNQAKMDRIILNGSTGGLLSLRES